MISIIEYLNENKSFSLLDYIFESDENKNKEKEDYKDVNEPDSKDNQNKLRKAAKKLFNLLQKKEDLSSYVETLNNVLKGKDTGDNTELYLKALTTIFNGKGDKNSKAYSQYTCEGETDIPVNELYPTQSEIDIENSAKWATKDWGAKGIGDMFKDEGFGTKFPVPVLVYNDGSKNWIIDGHHRWSQVALINPEAKLHCMVIRGSQSAKTFLKLTQSVIAGIVAERNNYESSDDKSPIPVGKAVPENNIFGKSLKGDKLKKKIVEMTKEHEDIFKICKKMLNKNDINVKSEEDLGELVMKNRDKMIENKQAPEKWAAPRPVMPQSDKAGKTGEEDSGPEKEGSALNKLKDVEALPNITEK